MAAIQRAKTSPPVAHPLTSATKTQKFLLNILHIHEIQTPGFGLRLLFSSAYLRW
jgi:hypothetical protein